MHNKKLLILAIGAVFAAPCAYAQKGGGGKEDKGDPDSVVELYGKVYPELVRQSGKDPTAAGTPVATFAAPPTGVESIITRNEMESSNSRFGVRGHEKLGGGLKAVFQLETQFLLDSNTTAFAQRDSWVGLSHDKWGLVKLGRFDTPFKEYGDDISFLNVSSGNFTSTSAVMRRFGFGTSSAARFHERRVNALQYESPQIGGLDFKAQYSTDEADTATRKPHVWSFGAKYEMGPFTILAGHEIHWDLFGGSNNVPTAMRNLADASARSKDKATEVAFTYKLGRHQFEVDYEWHEWKEFGFAPITANTTGRFQSYKNNAYLALWDARWSNQWRTQVHYVHATAGSCSRIFVVSTVANCITDGLDGTQISAGASYYLSRKTFLFFMVQRLRNGKSAIFASGTQTPSVGEDVTQYGAGIHTVF
jgi:predicted porin